MNEEDFEAALKLVRDDINSDTTVIAGQGVSVFRDLDINHDHEADVVFGTDTYYLTRLSTGTTYRLVGDIVSSYGRWADTTWGEWEKVA